MSGEIKVYVVAYPGRRNLVMRFKDPVTEKLVTKTAGTSKRKDAERAAAKWEEDLRTGRYVNPSQITWGEFRQRYEDESLSAMADSTFRKVGNILDLMERTLGLCDDTKLQRVTAAELSRFQAQLRKTRAEATVASYMGHVSAALGWAVEVGFIREAPTIARPKRKKGVKVMKGRPITAEELDRMLAKVVDVVGEPAAPSWRRLLQGLWWSGLRLGEALDLYWDREDRLHVDLTGKRPMLRIHAQLEKGNKDRLLPMAPEFAEFLLETPPAERRGRVFRLKARRDRGTEKLGLLHVSKTLCRVGQKAGVKVHTDPKTAKVKYGSAHDLRRSFGERWASRVMPQVLQELMRHESIETTLRYYVGRNAQNTAETIWNAYESTRNTVGSTLGNSAPKEPIASQANSIRKDKPR